MQSIYAITTTVEEKADAEKILAILFEQKLIGCAQVSGPLSSYYRWEDQMVNSSEYLLNLKTTGSHIDKVKEIISSHHPYDLPQIIGKKMDIVSDEYAKWIEGEVV